MLGFGLECAAADDGAADGDAGGNNFGGLITIRNL